MSDISMFGFKLHRHKMSLKVNSCNCHSGLDPESMVRQAHHDNCHTEHVEGWIPASAGMTDK